MTPQQKKAEKQYLSSIEKSNEFARGVKAYMRKHRIPADQYEMAAREYREELEDEGSNLHRVAVFGEDPDAEESTVRAYSELGKKYTRGEADRFLAELIERRVANGEDRKTATAEVFSDPDLADMVEIYNS